MLTMNHAAVMYLAALRKFGTKGNTQCTVEMANNYFDQNIAVLLLPDAIRMYGPRQQFHFTEHPVSGKISGVKLNTTPDKLKGIKNAFDANLMPDIPKCVIDEMSHPEEFTKINPGWAKTAYMTHLGQDCAWDEWIREMVDVSARLEDKFVYKKTGKVVDGTTFRKELGPLDNVFFQVIAKKIHAEFSILLDKEWFEKHVYANFMAAYDQELAANTWKYINIPSMDAALTLPAFVAVGELEAADRMVEATILY